MLVGLLVASSSGAFFARRQSGPLTLRGDLSGGVHTIRLSSTIVPKDVVRMAAQRSGVLTKGGGVPSAAAVSAFAQRINAWYRANGYVLARVQGCRPVVAGRLELEAFEPRVAREPVRNPHPHPKPNPNPNPSPSRNLTLALTLTRSASSSTRLQSWRRLRPSRPSPSRPRRRQRAPGCHGHRPSSAG